MKGIKYEIKQLLYGGGNRHKGNFADPLHKRLSNNPTEYTKVDAVYANAIFRARLDIGDKELPAKIEI